MENGSRKEPNRPDVRWGEWQNTAPENEPFVQCPKVFLQGLTPEEYRAQLQIYQQAYERAVRQVAWRNWHAEDLDSGGGI